MQASDFVVEDRPTAHDLEFLEDQIDRHNMTQTGAFDYRPLAIFVRNERQEIIAGVSGYTWAGMYELQFVWVHADARKQGYGRRLLQSAEQEARARGCAIVILGTYSFQAPAFYQKLGYAVVGRIDDCPPSHANYYLKKPLRDNV